MSVSYLKRVSKLAAHGEGRCRWIRKLPEAGSTEKLEMPFGKRPIGRPLEERTSNRTFPQIIRRRPKSSAAASPPPLLRFRSSAATPPMLLLRNPALNRPQSKPSPKSSAPQKSIPSRLRICRKNHESKSPSITEAISEV
ncbi:P-loop containing nucleoside triphosphatehydrolases superfamily protein [Striga asiatica]|uniref:P-loop containing nucleoside triphosphatehydrolases superfamily protein n=1 Tax=Striga asiatica TaxID=4170 RepID=A0A5A7P678_STRAF|nr:P-loop containing nucleoside triphosphatehydrolases superfamily protein [Striga asiatica]